MKVIFRYATIKRVAGLEKPKVLAITPLFVRIAIPEFISILGEKKQTKLSIAFILIFVVF